MIDIGTDKLSDCLTEFATIEVTDFESNKKVYAVHKMILANVSGFFDAMFYGAGVFMAEGQTGDYQFQETTHDAFALLIEFCYKQELDEDEFSVDTLIHLGILAERILAPKLRNEVLRKIESRCDDSLPSSQVIDLVFSDDYRDSCVRKLLAEYFALTQNLDVGDPQLPKALLSEVLVVAKDILKKKGGKFSNQRVNKYLVDEET